MVEKCHRHTSCRRRVLAVWHSWAAGLPDGTKLSSFYPGDDVVDWVGVSLFQQFYPNDVGGTVRDLQYVLEFASKHDKPTMIAESTPFGGIHNNTITKNANNMWEAWFQPTLNFIDRYNISMWSYINCNWNVQPLWKTANFGDTRISIDNEVMELWLQEVVSNPRFIFATDDELCGNAPYPHHYRYDYSFDDDFQYSDKHNHNTYHAYDDYHYRDDDFFSSSNRHDGQGLVDGDNAKNKSHNDNSSNSKGSWWLWGERRGVQNSDGLWNAVLPLVMLSSSLAIIIFFYMTKKRGGRLSQRLQRTPRARRVRFAQLDDQEDDDDQAVRQALYGGTGTGVHEHHHHHHHYHYGSITDSHHNKEQPPHWKRSVRRIGPNLVVTNTADGTTVTV